jgi:hypothetical protein
MAPVPTTKAETLRQSRLPIGMLGPNKVFGSRREIVTEKEIR